MRRSLFLSGVMLLSPVLLAQSPLSYQRSNNSPMAAEAGGSLSHGINPAGIYKLNPQPDTQVSLLIGGIEAAASKGLLDNILTGSLNFPDLSSISLVKLFQRILSLRQQGNSLTEQDRTFFIQLGGDLYKALVNGIPGLPSDPSQLNRTHFDTLSANRSTLINNLEDPALIKSVIEQLANPAIEELADLLGPWAGTRFYYDLFQLRFSNPLGPLNWGLNTSFRTKVITSVERNSPYRLPIFYRPNSSTDKLIMPLILQAYAQAELQASFAGAVGDSQSFRWGFSPHFSLFAGVNQRDIIYEIVELQKEFWKSPLGQASAPQTDNILSRIVNNLLGINVGLDLGVIYNFGSLLPELDFLNVGMQVRDLIGVVYQTGGRYPAEYSIDVDMGIFLSKKLGRSQIRVFGGIDLIAIRGMIQPNPYSELVQPIEHLRLLGGISFFEDRIKLSLQYYDDFLTPSLDFWLGIVRFGFQGEFGLRNQAVGLGFYLNFRSAEQAPFVGIGTGSYKGKAKGSKPTQPARSSAPSPIQPERATAPSPTQPERATAPSPTQPERATAPSPTQPERSTAPNPG